MHLLGRAARPIPLLLLATSLIVLVAIPVLAADPSPSPSAPQSARSAAPGQSKPEKAQGQKQKEKTPESDVTLKGAVGSRTSADGATEYTLTVGGKVLTLDAGPAWYYKDKNPLKAFLGKTVTVLGAQAQGSTEVEVRSVDGTMIREPGKPPWAGGWKVVGKDHPGWSQEKWDRWQAHLKDMKARFGLDCWPPGHCKTAAGTPQTP